MNKKEAEKILKTKLNEQAEKFCPLIKENCVMNCICLVNKIHENKYPDRTEYSALVYCDNDMFNESSC